MAPMPEDAPVTTAVPFPFPLLISYLRSPSDFGVEGESRLEGLRPKCHINGVLGHPAEGQMQRVGIVVFPGFQVVSLAVLSAFEFANAAAPEPVYELHVLSEGGGTVRSSAGLSVSAEPLDDIELDTLIVVGGTEVQPSTQGLIEFLRTVPDRARRVAATCTGAFVLAEAGLLDGRRATTHWMHARDMQRQYPDVKMDEDRIFINDGPIWTSAGMTAGIDLGLALIENDLGPELAKSVARKLVVYHRRGGGQSQFSTLLELSPKSDRIQAALAYARDNLHKPLTVPDLAEAAHLS